MNYITAAEKAGFKFVSKKALSPSLSLTTSTRPRPTEGCNGKNSDTKGSSRTYSILRHP